jgi:RNase P/RNase MRP subunit POP5
MPTKVPGEKWRYIAFSIGGEGAFARSDFLDSLFRASKGTPLWNAFRITVYQDNFGILKVPHTLKDEAIRVLSAVDSVRGRPCRVVPLKTSGTIKTLKLKYAARIADSQERA